MCELVDEQKTVGVSCFIRLLKMTFVYVQNKKTSCKNYDSCQELKKKNCDVATWTQISHAERSSCLDGSAKNQDLKRELVCFPKAKLILTTAILEPFYQQSPSIKQFHLKDLLNLTEAGLKTLSDAKIQLMII